MSHVSIQSFIELNGVVRDRLAFQKAYLNGTGLSSIDFPVGLTMYHWYIAHMGWTLMNAIQPAMVGYDGFGMPDKVKPLADLHADRGFYVMVGTVGHLLTLSGFDQAAVEFVSRAHHLEFDTGQLFMLAYDYVRSNSELHEPDAYAGEEDTRG